jgi:hypothetical protein
VQSALKRCGTQGGIPRPAATKPSFGEDNSLLIRARRYRWVRVKLIVLS